jgi:hypothetical protein
MFLAFAIFSSLVPSTVLARALPAAVTNNFTVGIDSISSLESRRLVKRRTWVYMCYNNEKYELEDVKLARRCSKSPFNYVCDSEGLPDGSKFRAGRSSRILCTNKPRRQTRRPM